VKWPNTVTIVRHGESAYNVLRELKEKHPAYQAFKEAYDSGTSSQRSLRRMAKKVMKAGDLVLKTGNHQTEMTERGIEQAQITGRRLSELIELPDVVFVSPYDRTLGTLGYMAEGWPELKNVKTIVDERFREQEHGQQEVYADWRIFHLMNPDQRLLYERNGPYYYKYPGGENVPDVRERTRSVFNSVSRDYAERNVMIVAHHLTILGIRANLERLSDLEFMDLDDNNKPINCGVTIYQGYPDLGNDGKLLLEKYNERLY
jgi:2,3-bisphosphoglycerate-dependent phosphoglycerate mutase